MLLLISHEINQYSMQSLSKGVARGGSMGARDPPFVSLFWANNLQQVARTPWSRHGNLVSTLTLTQCDPPLKNPAYAPAEFQIY